MVAATKKTFNRDELQSEVDRLGPFLYNIELPFGLRTVPEEASVNEAHEDRLTDLIECVLKPLVEKVGSLENLTVCEVACNCGGLSLEIAQRGARSVLGTDIVQDYIDQANFLKSVLDVGNVEFKKAGIDDMIGQYDVTVCCGLLYHLENPVASMRTLSGASKRMLVLDTQVVPNVSEPLWYMSVVQPLSRHSPIATTGLWRHETGLQFRPSIAAVIRLLKILGFERIELLPINSDLRTKSRRKGSVRTFIAERDYGK